jgi:hypothetical protein
MGNSRRDWTVVNATMVPAVMPASPKAKELLLPALNSQPETKYTIAGTADMKTLTTLKKSWPLIAWRTCNVIWCAFSSE